MPATLVSGGTGLVGRFVVEALLAAGHAVTLLGRTAPPAGFFPRATGFVEAALDPGCDRSAAFAGIDFFVHAAFDHLPGRYRGGEGDDPAGFRRRNLDGSLALFDQAKRAGVRRVVFLSSRAVYGRQPPGAALFEDTPCHPDTLYGTVKHAAEQGLFGLGDAGFCAAALRITGVYGPPAANRAHKWQPLFDDFLAGRPVAPRVAGEVHGADVGQAVRHVLAAAPGAVCGEVFNVADIVLDRHDLLALVGEAAGAGGPLPALADQAPLNLMDTRKLRALGWRPGGMALLKHTVREMCARR
ncbi:MAG: NAD(P)-dependent oxidoreductase [Nitratireductor sp.]